MLKYYDHSKLQNDILKCDQCKKSFDEYCQSQFLPCHKTICSTCVFGIQKKAINKKFKCGVCLKEHQIPDDGFVLNEKINELLLSEPIEITRGHEYKQLRENLSHLEALLKSLKFDTDNAIDIIKEHCIEQKRLVQLSTENLIDKINKLNIELIEIVDEYEKKCSQSFLDNSEKFKTVINKKIEETNFFIKEKQDYLSQFKINDQDIKSFNKTSDDFKTALKIETVKLKSLIFNNELIKFQSNTTEINKQILGNIYYESSSEPKKVFSASFDKTIKQWDLDSNECIKTFDGHTSAVTCIKQATGNILISGSRDGSIKIWNNQTGECFKTIIAHTKTVNKIEMASNETFLSCSCDATIKIFDLNTFECIRTLIKHEDEVNDMDRICDNNIVSCSNDQTIMRWELNTGKCLKVIRAHSDLVLYIKVFTQKRLISGSLNEIKVWHSESGTCLQKLYGHSKWISGIIQLENEKVASFDEFGKIKIWNISNGGCLKVIQAHTSYIWYLAKLSNNKIISCSADKKIKLWDIETGNCLKTLEGHTNDVACLDFN